MPSLLLENSPEKNLAGELPGSLEDSLKPTARIGLTCERSLALEGTNVAAESRLVDPCVFWLFGGLLLLCNRLSLTPLLTHFPLFSFSFKSLQLPGSSFFSSFALFPSLSYHNHFFHPLSPSPASPADLRPSSHHVLAGLDLCRNCPLVSQPRNSIRQHPTPGTATLSLAATA